MSYSYQVHTGNGTQTNFTVAFPYITTSHVVVKVNGVTKTLGTDYSFDGTSTIHFNVAPVNGATIVFDRSTSPGTRLVQYTSGAMLTTTVLNRDSLQA